MSKPLWHSYFPTPSFDSRHVSADDLKELIETKTVGKDFLVVDVRRSDFEVRGCYQCISCGPHADVLNTLSSELVHHRGPKPPSPLILPNYQHHRTAPLPHSHHRFPL